MTNEGEKTVVLGEDTALSQTETQEGDKVAVHGDGVARGNSNAQEGDSVAVVGDDVAQAKGGGLSYDKPGQGDTSDGEYIEAVRIGDYENVSGDNDGYADFTDDEVIDVSTAGTGLEVEISTGGNTNYVNAWIDTNEDGEFKDENVHKIGSCQANEDGTCTVSTEFSLPEDLAGDLTDELRLRITSSREDRDKPPTGGYKGETEDYKIRVYGAPEGMGDEYIKSVDIKGVYNESGDNDGYADFTEFSFEAGSLEEVEVEVELVTFGETNYVNLWIDTDNDTEFNDEKNFYIGECGVEAGGGTIPESCTVSTTIKIPGMEAGAHRLRITSAREDFSSPPRPGTVYYGETEDYTIEVPESEAFPPDTLGIKITSVESPVGYGQNADVTAVIKNTKDFSEAGNATLKIQERDGSYTSVDTVSINSLGSYESVTKTLTWNTDFGFPEPNDGKEEWNIKVDTEADGTPGIEDEDTGSIVVRNDVYVVKQTVSLTDLTTSGQNRQVLNGDVTARYVRCSIGGYPISQEETGGTPSSRNILRLDGVQYQREWEWEDGEATLFNTTLPHGSDLMIDFGELLNGELEVGAGDAYSSISPP